MCAQKIQQRLERIVPTVGASMAVQKKKYVSSHIPSVGKAKGFLLHRSLSHPAATLFLD